ncbi:MAG: FixH family protein [Pseudomonadota bacterium]
MSTTFRITGRHVLFGMIGFFLVIIAVNIVFLTLAVQSFPGEQEKKSYLQGLNFNDRLAAREAQAALGWTVNIDKAELAAEAATIELSFETREERPIFDLDIDGVLSQPADNDRDQSIVFSASGPGRFEAQADNITPGVWVLNARAVSSQNETFEFTTKLYFE